MGERGGFGWGGVKGWGENADNCNWITIKIFKKKKILAQNSKKKRKEKDAEWTVNLRIKANQNLKKTPTKHKDI